MSANVCFTEKSLTGQMNLQTNTHRQHSSQWSLLSTKHTQMVVQWLSVIISQSQTLAFDTQINSLHRHFSAAQKTQTWDQIALFPLLLKINCSLKVLSKPFSWRNARLPDCICCIPLQIWVNVLHCRYLNNNICLPCLRTPLNPFYSVNYSFKSYVSYCCFSHNCALTDLKCKCVTKTTSSVQNRRTIAL